MMEFRENEMQRLARDHKKKALRKLDQPPGELPAIRRQRKDLNNSRLYLLLGARFFFVFYVGWLRACVLVLAKNYRIVGKI